ncbi:hypothetical protein [Thermococcus thioreducens]|uniref:Uncharacterized protein n=1 Tax=Thermococcus thioreducens TaxID=277988 RepID=A0A0Q2UQM4_9EURY|nr:hypothetical protein [Thermococcus thioreducens]ASJ12229.1 hypothetical protein A3L14_04705 [Thermococcus thioreducens]KQH82968.1 hypothetical protein AMR53_01700 [Thermococcus thioreducens]SEV94519.1 hypothetical protein SAMN05216170_1026 [Thermococcus thioreducens]
MKAEGSSPMKWGISLIMTLAYAFGAALFYYLPARGEPNLDVEFWGLLVHFLVLSFLFWVVLIPERESGDALDVLMLTLLTVPAGAVVALFFIFAVTSFGIYETWGAEYFVMALVPFLLAYRTVKGRISALPFILAIAYGVLAYVWGRGL